MSLAANKVGTRAKGRHSTAGLPFRSASECVLLTSGAGRCVQVIRSRDRLLDQLYTYLSSLKPVEIEALLAEDPNVARRRTAAQQATKDLADAQLEVRKIEVGAGAGCGSVSW